MTLAITTVILLLFVIAAAQARRENALVSLMQWVSGLAIFLIIYLTVREYLLGDSMLITHRLTFRPFVLIHDIAFASALICAILFVSIYWLLIKKYGRQFHISSRR
ncbi:MAG: hypothetical protein K0R10_1182 [Alphaproteobacteria bacterium]|jgi:hypothetical protein|nr:hypothetical protein [Alphaproteobacteria bacterium]